MFDFLLPRAVVDRRGSVLEPDPLSASQQRMKGFAHIDQGVFPLGIKALDVLLDLRFAVIPDHHRAHIGGQRNVTLPLQPEVGGTHGVQGYEKIVRRLFHGGEGAAAPVGAELDVGL